MTSVSVIIPTCNAGKYIGQQLDILLRQTVKPCEIIVVDSASDDTTCQIATSQGEPVKLLEIRREEFDHGGTRDFALRQTEGDYVLFLTQDALPIDERYIENLIAPMVRDTAVAAVCARQVAYPDAREYERLNREFNYPTQGRVWSADDIDRFGEKAYFFSDACSAYRRSAYDAVGGFDRPIETNEDMLIAAKLIHAGYKLAYEPTAQVYHSHCFSLRHEYERNKSIARVMARYSERLVGANNDREGMRLALTVSGQLLRQGRLVSLVRFIAVLAARFLGNRAGKR